MGSFYYFTVSLIWIYVMKMKLSVFTSLFAPYVTPLGESTVEVFDPFSRAQGLSGFDAWV